MRTLEENECNFVTGANGAIIAGAVNAISVISGAVTIYDYATRDPAPTPEPTTITLVELPPPPPLAAEPFRVDYIDFYPPESHAFV